MAAPLGVGKDDSLSRGQRGIKSQNMVETAFNFQLSDKLSLDSQTNSQYADVVILFMGWGAISLS